MKIFEKITDGKDRELGYRVKCAACGAEVHGLLMDAHECPKKEFVGWRACFEWKLEDFWIGVFWKNQEDVLDVWVCLLPCVPLHVRLVFANPLPKSGSQKVQEFCKENGYS